MTLDDPQHQRIAAELAFELAHIGTFAIAADQTCTWSPQVLRVMQLTDTDVPEQWSAFVERHVEEESRREALELPTRARIGHAHGEIDLRGGDERVRVAIRMKQNDSVVVAVVQDVSHMQAREAALLQAGESRDRLQQLGRWSLLGEMASGLAHEINQPLAAISAFAQAGERMLQLNPPKLERAGTLFGEISGQALRAGDVIQRMRSLVKRQGSQARALTCAEILSDFRALAEPIARTQQIRLEIAEAPTNSKVLIDPTHIQQVMMSLFRNAIDAMRELPAAERRVQVQAAQVGDQVEFVIIDTGPGIPDHVARELFRPFFTTKPDGTGLGLSVCRSIIAEHGGTLRFTNASPGARFSILLPRVD